MLANLPRTKRILLGRFDGVPVEISWGFFAIAALLTFPIWSKPHLGNGLLAIALTGILFLSIFAHEFAHVAMGRKVGVQAHGIEINALGGLARFWHMPYKWQSRCLIYAAGPLANFALAGIFWAIWFAVPYGLATLPVESYSTVPPYPTFPLHDTSYYVSRGLYFAWIGNLLLGMINLLPAFPLDGGAIGYILLSQKMSARNAARIIGLCGMVLAGFSLLLMFGSILSGFFLWVPPSFEPNRRAFRLQQPVWVER